MDILLKNKAHYDRYWKFSEVINPSIWPQWRITKNFKNKKCLEIGPGLRPRISLKKNYFIDISEEVIKKLCKKGANAYISDLQSKFPFKSETFDLVCAFEVLEHVKNDDFVISEIVRVLKKNGVCLLSFPIHMRLWSAFDKAVGHFRRYDSLKIEDFIQSMRLHIRCYAPLGIPWPGKVTGTLFYYAIKWLPRLFAQMQDFFDKTPLSSLRKPFRLKSWNKYSYQDLDNASTVFLYCVKNDNR